MIIASYIKIIFFLIFELISRNTMQIEKAMNLCLKKKVKFFLIFRTLQREIIKILLVNFKTSSISLIDVSFSFVDLLESISLLSQNQLES